MKKLLTFLLIFVFTACASVPVYSHPAKKGSPPPAIITPNDRVISIKGPITFKLADRVCQQLINYNKSSESQPIYMFIDSPGGFVDAGEKIIAVMNVTKAPITGVVTNYCMSMAIYILATCDNRFAMEGSDFLIHNIQLTIYSAPVHEVLFYSEKALAHNVFLLNYLNGILKMNLNELIVNSSMEWLFDNKTAWNINLINGVVKELHINKDSAVNDLFLQESEEKDPFDDLKKEIERRHKKDPVFMVN